MGEAAAADDRLKRALPRLVAASLLMCAVLLVGEQLLRPALAADGLRYLALAGLVGLGMASYALAVFATGALRAADIRAALRRPA